MMKAITRLAAFTVGVTALTVSAFATAPAGWSTNLDEAFAKAKAENKHVLVEFTGSDWCPPCIFLSKNVLSKKEFIEPASKNFILVELDFPHGDEALAKKNEPFAEKYGIEGFPTIVLFTPDGKEFNRFFATGIAKPEELLTVLDMALERKDLD